MGSPGPTGPVGQVGDRGTAGPRGPTGGTGPQGTAGQPGLIYSASSVLLVFGVVHWTRDEDRVYCLSVRFKVSR